MTSKMNNRFEDSTKSSDKDTAPIPKFNNLFSEEEKKSDGGTIERLKEFCGYTTAHGLGRLVDSKSYVRRLFWVMACLGAFTMFTSQVISLAEQYLSKPVETYITMKYVRNIDFPVVTVCNQNAIRRSILYSNNTEILQEQLKNLLNGSKEEKLTDLSSSKSKKKVRRDIPRNLSKIGEEISESIISPSSTHAPLMGSIFTTSSPKINETNLDETRKKNKKKTKTKKTKGNKTDEDTNANGEEMADFVAKQERVQVALATWSEDKLTKMGHQFKDMFRECTYRGKSCMKSRFWDSFWHYKYGNCFTFNKYSDLMAGGPGPAYGLVLEMNVEQNEYLGDLTQDAGIRVQIEDKGKVPFPYEKGFSVGPGSATSVGIRKVKIMRVKTSKKGSCIGEIDPLSEDNLLQLKHNASYSTTACRESCLSDKENEKCGCREYRFPRDDSKNERVCDVLNATVAKCLNKVLKRYKKSNLGCSRKCTSPCNENVYKLTISTSKFPSLAYQRILLANKKKLEKRNIPSNLLSSYLLQLNVFFEELNYEVIEERIGYGLVNFIADIGGNVGIWIGVSALTIAEILELLCIIIHHVIKTCTHRSSKILAFK